MTLSVADLRSSAGVPSITVTDDVDGAVVAGVPWTASVVQTSQAGAPRSVTWKAVQPQLAAAADAIAAALIAQGYADSDAEAVRATVASLPAVAAAPQPGMAAMLLPPTGAPPAPSSSR